MIKVALNNNGFIITSNNKNLKQPDHIWGSWVDIVNFEQGSDGILEVDVKCKSLVKLISIEKNAENLHFSMVKVTSHWSQNNVSEVSDTLFEALNSVFEQSPLLKSLYKKDMTENTNWLIARWLEILPVSLDVKILFSSYDTFQTAQEFVHSIVLLNKKQLKQLNA